jgi:Holliday junction resolvase RusA-like endonuclease
MAGKIDVRNLYRRIGRLQAVNDAASVVLAQSGYQRPLIETADAAGYWHVPADAMQWLRDAIDTAAANDDSAPIGASVQRDPRPLAGQPEPDEATVIRLPYAPNRELSANKATRGKHWGGFADLMKAEKERAGRALSEWIQDEPFYTEPIQASIRVAWGTSLHAGAKQARIEQDRYLDFDGLTLCLKPILDAFTAARIWKDDRLIHRSTLEQAVDASGDGYTELMIWPMAG